MMNQSVGSKQSVSELMRAKSGEDDKAAMNEMESYKPESESVKEMIDELESMDPGPKCDAKIDETVKKLLAMKSKKPSEDPAESKPTEPPFRFK